LRTVRPVQENEKTLKKGEGVADLIENRHSGESAPKVKWPMAQVPLGCRNPEKSTLS
jgi:hypothetical protein